MPLDKVTPLHIGIVGAGFISEYHIEGLRATGIADVSVLVGRNEKRTAQRAAKFGIAETETSIDKVLANKAIDAIVVATPDATHRAIAVAALYAGKPVLLQKPMALNTLECEEILSAARKSGTHLSVSFMHRYFPEVRWLKSLLDTGSLGRVDSVRIRNATPGADWAEWFYQVGKVSGGVVMQLGVHGIDLCQYLFGAIELVSAKTTKARPRKLLADGRNIRTSFEDNALAHYCLSNGTLVSHEMSYTETAGSDRFRLELYAEKGTVCLRSARGHAAIYAPEITGVQRWSLPEFSTEPIGRAHHEHWISMLNGKLPLDDTAIAGASTLCVAETLYRAAESGCTERVTINRKYRSHGCYRRGGKSSNF